MYIGRIIKGVGGFYYIYKDGEVYECKGRGLFRKNKEKLLVGDIVEFSISDQKDSHGTIEKILPRKNKIIRPEVANIDQIIIVFSIDEPSPNLLFIDKLIALSELNNLDIILCLNKMDLYKDNEKHNNIINIYESLEYPLIKLGLTDKPVENLVEYMDEKVTVFAGASGVGKSSIINEIIPGLKFETGEISKKISRGKHTTRHSELVHFKKNTFIVDTPGFTSIDIEGIEKERIKDLFIDIKNFSTDCKFNTCNHIKEPHCNVKLAVEDGNINKKRYENYVYLFNNHKDKRR